MPTPEQVRAAVDAYVAAYNADDQAAFLACFAPDAVLTDPVGTPDHVGSDAMAAFWDQVHALSPEIRLHPERVTVCGGEAAMVFTIEAAGMRLPAVETFEVDDAGRVARLRAFWDLGDGAPA